MSMCFGGGCASAKMHLEHCLKSDTLLSGEYLRSDSDLDSLRVLKWFKALVAKAYKKAKSL